MSTIVTALERVSLDPVTLSKVSDMTTGTLFTTYTTYENFKDLGAVNRPQSFLLNLLTHFGVDKVIQLGYNGLKSDLVIEAELCDVDVVLVRSMT